MAKYELGDFSKEEGDTLRHEWSFLSKDYRTNGTAVFAVLFRKHPHYQKLFSQFNNEQWEDLTSNLRLMCHAQYVLKKIGEVVVNADDYEKRDQMLELLGCEHGSRKVTSAMIGNILPIVQRQIVVSTGGKMTKPLWDRFFLYFKTRMSQGLKSPIKPEPSPSAEAVTDVFNSWDSDNDGVLSCKELQSIMVNMASFEAEDQIVGLIETAEKSDDKSISLEQFRNHFWKKKSQSDEGFPDEDDEFSPDS